MSSSQAPMNPYESNHTNPYPVPSVSLSKSGHSLDLTNTRSQWHHSFSFRRLWKWGSNRRWIYLRSLTCRHKPLLSIHTSGSCVQIHWKKLRQIKIFPNRNRCTYITVSEPYPAVRTPRTQEVTWVVLVHSEEINIIS